MSGRRWLSPLRYPGGKARLATRLGHCLDTAVSGMDVEIWCEPFAGGLGAGLALIDDDAYCEVWATEKNPALAAFWAECLEDGRDFAREIVLHGKPDLDVFYAARHLALNPEEAESRRDLALAAFVANRCSRSGIISGSSGPIGGKDQRRYGVADRYTPEALAERIRFVHSVRHRLFVREGDGIETVADLRGSGIEDEVFVFADPPYVAMGNRLYERGMNSGDHLRLSEALRGLESPWLATYDAHPWIRELYADQAITEYRIRQSANTSKSDVEYAIHRPVDEVFRQILPTRGER